jgi:2-dehydropantoate 2-reductase
MRILVFGAGAIGGYFGGRLIQAGRDVTFLVRQNEPSKSRPKGCGFSAQRMAISPFRPKTITAAQIVSPYDVIFLSVKSYDRRDR